MKYSAEMIENIKRDYSDKSISRREICEKYGIVSEKALMVLMHKHGGFRGSKQDRRGTRKIENILALLNRGGYFKIFHFKLCQENTSLI